MSKVSVSILQRGKQSWRVRTRWRDPETGIWQEHNETIRGTRAVAEAHKRNIEDRFATGQMTKLSAQSVGRFIEDFITYRVAMGDLKETSAQAYRSMLKNFTDLHGNTPLVSVKPDMVKDWLRQVVLTKGSGTARYTANILKMIFAAAVKEGVMLSNPFDQITLPKKEKSRKERTLDADQIKKVFAASREDSERGFLVRLALETGLRRGELAALQWGDITEDGVIRVRKTAVVLRGSNNIRVWEPKTERSKRDIRVTDAMRDELNQRRGEPHQFLFGDGDGKEPPHPGAISYRLQAAMAAAGVKGFTAHDLRHAHATHLLRQRLPVAAVSKRLGHSKTSITLDVYSHALVDDDTAIVAAMDAVLR